MTSPQEFYTSFQPSRAAILSQLDDLTTSQRPATPDQIAQIAQQIQVERKRLNEATAYLPAYDRRSYETQLQDLESRIDALRSKNVPAKGAFSFKKKTPTASAAPKSSTSTSSNTPKDVAVPTPTPASFSSQPLPTPSTPTSATPPTHNLTSSSHKILPLSSLSLSPTFSSTTTSTNLTITSLTNCIVDLLSQPPLVDSDSDSNDNDNESPNLTAVHIRDVSNSILLLGHIQGSILAHNLDHCTVVASCHQLRIHASQKTTFYIHITSNGIIEDSTALSFAPYPSSLPLPPEVRQQESRHTSIQDFSHPKLSTPSPNWLSIPSPSPPSPSSSSAADWTWDDIRALSRLTTTTTTNSGFQGAGTEKDEQKQKNKIDHLLTRVLPRD